MPWNPQGGGGGPWGSGGGPWGRPPRGNGGPPPEGPDFEDLFRRGQEKLRQSLPLRRLGGGGGIGLAVLAVLGLWLASGLYQVRNNQQGVVLRFGQWVQTTQPGLHYHLPYPIETVLLPNVTAVNQLQVGFRSGPYQNGRRDVPEESRMLTGDENIVEADFTVFWQVRNAGHFLFNVRNPEGTVKVAAESAMREVIGRYPIQAALSDKRNEIAQEATEETQALLDDYHAGIAIKQIQLQRVDPPAAVIDAFNDVQRARADQDRLRNEAQAYSNDVVPRAHGDAERIVQAAQAYKQKAVDLATGEAKRFTDILASYRTAPDVTAQRMYLDTMQQILAHATKVIIDPSAKGAQGVVPYLPLPAFSGEPPAAKGAKSDNAKNDDAKTGEAAQ
jgi:membrane protease subunit HflK